MVRYFLTDLRGNPIYSFAQRLRRNNNNHHLLFPQHRLLSALDRHRASSPSSPAAPATFSTTTLVCMIRNQAWADVIKRIHSHPGEVTVQDPLTGNTVLHLTCQLNPPSTVVQALLHNQQVPVRRANHQGATALHTAVSHRCSASVLQVLLQAQNSTSSECGLHTSKTADLSRMGRAPIHYACMSFRGLDMDAFRLLVDATLKEGNVWVRRCNEEEDDFEYGGASASQGMMSSHNPRGVLLEGEDEDNDEYDDNNDEESPNSFLCEFATEFGDGKHNLFMPIDDLTCESSRHHGGPEEEAPVLVNVMGLKDATGQTPLSLLFRRYRERVRCVINTVDRLRDSTHDNNPHRAALVAAIRVHADLGELWEKARFIIARLTEERLQRETQEDTVPPQQLTGGDATSRRTTYFGTAKSCAFYDPTADPPSPGATAWAVENHREVEICQDEILPLVSALDTDNLESSTTADGETMGKPKKTHKFRIVHASVGLTGYGCPPELIRLAISVHPHQVMEMDEEGNLPIHIAATAASYLATAHGAVRCPEAVAAAAAAAAGDDHSVLSDAAMSFFSSASVSQTTNPFDKVIKILLQHYPEAARIPHGKTGRLPLVMAIESGRRTWADGVETLLHAYPPALHHKKVVEPHLFPDVLARVSAPSSQQNNTPLEYWEKPPTHSNKNNKRSSSRRSTRHETCTRSTLFELIRTKPEWVTRGYLPAEG